MRQWHLLARDSRWINEKNHCPPKTKENSVEQNQSIERYEDWMGKVCCLVVMYWITNLRTTRFTSSLLHIDNIRELGPDRISSSLASHNRVSGLHLIMFVCALFVEIPHEYRQAHDKSRSLIGFSGAESPEMWIRIYRFACSSRRFCISGVTLSDHGVMMR